MPPGPARAPCRPRIARRRRWRRCRPAVPLVQAPPVSARPPADGPGADAVAAANGSPPANGAAVGNGAGPAAAPITRDELTARLLEVVAERTGYPTDMLDLDADVEA